MRATKDQLGGAVRQRRALDHVPRLHPPLHLSCPSVQYVDVVVIATWNVQDVKWSFFYGVSTPKAHAVCQIFKHLKMSTPDAVSITWRKSRCCFHYMEQITDMPRSFPWEERVGFKVKKQMNEQLVTVALTHYMAQIRLAKAISLLRESLLQGKIKCMVHWWLLL